MLFDLWNENYLETQNENLRDKIFDSENEYVKLNYKMHKIKERYDVLRERHSVVLNENKKLNAENERLRKWIERLFQRIHVLEWRNAEWLKDYKQLKSEILSDEKWKYDKVAEEIVKL